MRNEKHQIFVFFYIQIPTKTYTSRANRTCQLGLSYANMVESTIVRTEVYKAAYIFLIALAYEISFVTK